MQIHKAASKGDQAAVLRELESGVPVDALDEEHQTPLTAAVKSEQSNAATMQLLLDRGANPNAIGGEYPNSVLLSAIGSGDLLRVQCLLDAGADINLTTEDSVSALIYAVNRVVRLNDQNSLSVIELLLERGADVHWEEDGESALSVAFQYGQFDLVKRLLEADADESSLGWTPLMRAVVLGTVDDVRQQLELGANLEDKDELCERTPLLLSVEMGDIEKAKILLQAGAKIDDMGWYEKTTLMYPIEANNPEILKWLLSIGCDVEAAGDFGNTPLMAAANEDSLPFVQMLLDAGADPHKRDRSERKAISHTSSLEIIHLLLTTEQTLDDLDPRIRALLLGIEYEGDLVTSREEFESGRECRFGTSNPEKMGIPFWHAMVRSGAPAYIGRRLFVPRDEWFTPEDTPIWCHHRFAMSLTELPDGRFIEIGGEHEDSYDRDFYIYNDVVVYHPDKTFDIWGYPSEVFPPTDGHSATLVGDFIYIIGCTGHPEDRIVGYTPVYRLNVETLAIEKVETNGENPGWIFKHKAVLIGDEIHISGGEPWLGPPSPEERAANIARMQKMVTFPVREDFALDSEWVTATGQHLDENRIKQYKSPERFALNLKTLNWRHVTD